MGHDDDTHLPSTIKQPKHAQRNKDTISLLCRFLFFFNQIAQDLTRPGGVAQISIEYTEYTFFTPCTEYDGEPGVQTLEQSKKGKATQRGNGPRTKHNSVSD